MRNKNESEPDVKKDSDQNIDYLQMDLNADTEPKKDCDQLRDYLQAAPEQKTDLDDGPSKPKVDSEVDLMNKPSLKMECSRTATDNRSSRPHKRMSPSSRCLRSSGSVCNKKPKKERSSRNSQKAGKTMYDLSDLIRAKGHSKPQSKPKLKSRPKKKTRKNSHKTDERNNKTEQEVEINNSMPNDVNIEIIDASDEQAAEANKTITDTEQPNTESDVMNDKMDKKVLLCERKRQTTRHVAIAIFLLLWMGGGPSTKIFFSQSEHVSSQICCQKIFPLLRPGTPPPKI